MEGGTETGFNIEPTEDTPHLYRVWYAHVVTQVDLSVLFGRRCLYSHCQQGQQVALNGKSANPDEKAKANSMAENMCT
jgi:hypothetical protein